MGLGFYNDLTETPYDAHAPHSLKCLRDSTFAGDLLAHITSLRQEDKGTFPEYTSVLASTTLDRVVLVVVSL